MNRKLRIGYLPFYVSYYENVDPTFGVEKPEAARRAASTLAEFGDVLWDGKLIGDAEASDAAGKALAAQKPDCVVVLTTIAVFGSISSAALTHLDVPLLLWNAQQIESVDAGYSMVEIVRNTGQIGTQALANTLLRMGKPFRVITGYEQGEFTAEALDRYFRSIRAYVGVREARLLALGDGFPAMTDIAIDEAHLAATLGPVVSHVDQAGLTRAFLDVAPAAVEAHRESIADRVDRATLTEDAELRSLRLAEAVKTLCDAHQADGGTLNCHVGNCMRNPEIGITACYSLGLQNALGRPFTCTGDIPTAIGMLLLKRLTGCAMYTEVQVLDEKRNAIVLSNSGEGEPAIRREGSREQIRGNTNFPAVHGRGASFAYPMAAGPVTVVSFTPSPKSTRPARLIVMEGTILDEAMPDVGALAGFFRFSNFAVHEGYRRWLEAGPVHHAGTTRGHWAAEIEYVAQLLDIDFVSI